MTIDPIALEIGPIAIRWYGIIMAVALGTATMLALRLARREKLDEDHILNLVLLVAPLSWLGARLYYVIFNWSEYASDPMEIFKIWHGGLAIHGGILTAIVLGYIYIRRFRLDFWQIADLTAPCFVLGQAIGRWGNFFNQEAYGYTTNLPWAMYIAGAYRHPTFLYESIWDLGICLLLLWLGSRTKGPRGRLFLLWLGLYSVGRFFIEMLRTDSLMLGPLRQAQVISVVIFAASMALLAWRWRKWKKPENIS
ncbi:MAG TPA: prolipoprotein diacylglyceryl transferase [Bacillota bacterium]|nr:prolipoprotein diacylglyceryl transferase [Bacillota bacterium]